MGFRFAAEIGKTYYVEGSIDLVSWASMFGLVADSPEETVEVSILRSEHHKYFRVVSSR